ncbi:hypothetical protein BJ508DRAFT_77443 [Ascobolus immersus RN42]|uniref:Carrier domain-containing protein n=1 Tax=Ascobolus immersus RN42 TaxID=1160509 RepID=A0A3N4IN42_ASCIM|nr:hypothetical protein BJ508DRAFT_77443 [Ascobolus immersus RN42]
MATQTTSRGQEAMALPPPTSFPNLHPEIHQAEGSEKYGVAYVGFPARTPEEEIIWSWAILLRAYGAGDSVTFGVNSRFVTVDFDEKKSTVFDYPIESTTNHVASTAIYFEKPSSSQTLASVYLQKAARGFLLHGSEALLPSSHLTHMAAQLTHIQSNKPSASSCEVSNAYPSHLALSVLNASPTRIPGPTLLHELFTETVLERPHDLALEHLNSEGQTETFTYQQLDAMSDVVAERLKPFLSSGKSNIVPLLLPQGPYLYASQLGILKAGGAFAPLNLDVPRDRLKFILSDVEAQVVITIDMFLHNFEWDGCPPVVNVEQQGLYTCKSAEKREHSPVKQNIDSTKPAYVMYTSGSTGLPKGVIIPHSAATQALLAHDRFIPEFSRFLQFAAPTFDVSVYEIFFPFMRGATLISSDRARLLADVPGVINQLKVDGAEFTPTVLGSLVVKKEKVPQLRVALTIGEMLTRKVVDEFGFSDGADDGVLQGMYGPTEAAIHCSVAQDFKKSYRVGDIGIPFDTVSAFILGPHVKGQEPEILPLGFVGELAVGGHQLATGYLKRPEVNEKAFIPTEKHGMLYRTGDKAMFLPSGRMVCLGRIGHGQVKLRGQRVELGEIEEAIRNTPGVINVVASVISSTLVAFVGGQGFDKDDIKNTCEKWLPKYMIPSDFVLLDEIPRNPSGKADRKLLENEYIQTRERANDDVEDFSELEAVVAKIVSAVLGRSNISRSESLVAGGLDSILAIRFTSELRAQGYEIAIADVLRDDTIAAIANIISKEDKSLLIADEEVSKLLISANELGMQHLRQILDPQSISQIQGVLPCTAVQQAMLAETHVDPSAYCNFNQLFIPSQFTTSQVKKAFIELINRNEILRTGFVFTNATGFSQAVWKTARPHQVKENSSLLTGFSFKIDEANGEPPFTVHLVQSNEGTDVSVQLHHALYDGWSWEELIEDLQALLMGEQVSERPQYREIVKYDIASSGSEAMEAASSFWTSYLDAIEPSEMPVLHSVANTPPGIYTVSSFLRSSKVELEDVAKQCRVSPQVIVQTAWAYLLSLYLGSDDIVFGTVASGRTIPVPDVDRIYGPTIQTLPIRLRLGGLKTIEEVLQSLHSSNRSHLEFGNLPLREIKRAAKLEGASKLFSSLLIWQQTLRNPDAEYLIKQLDSQDNLEFPVLLEFQPSSKGILARGTFQQQYIPRGHAEVILQQLDGIIAVLVEDPSIRIQDVPNHLEVSLLAVANEYPTTPSVSHTPSLQAYFERSAVKYKDSPAVEFAHDIINGKAESTVLTYSQLNEKANKLAHHLIKKGAMSGQLVAVCMDKSIELYVSILAILKTGAGYLPLQADAPNGRIASILEQSSTKLFLTSSEVAQGFSLPENIEVIAVENLNLSSQSTRNPNVKMYPSMVAYTTFTSGSTGTPKGVVITHRNVLTNNLCLLDLYPALKGGKTLQFCSHTFDVSVFELFWTWGAGMCLATASKDTLLRDLQAVVNALEITHLSLTSTVAGLVKSNKCPTVQFFTQVGEKITDKVINEWVDLKLGLWNGYGPTEATNIVTYAGRMNRIDAPSNIGIPLPTTSFFCLAERDEFQILPIGAAGELCFGGCQIGQGYFNMPELTAEKFITHPEFGRIYRTGDVGRLLADGKIQLIGRKDDQIKIRGLRVELGEISSVLREQEGIYNAETAVVRDDNNVDTIISFIAVLADNNSEVAVAEGVFEGFAKAFAAMKDSLPPYMVPAAVVPLTRLPINAAGKADKKEMIRLFKQLNATQLEAFTDGESVDESDWNSVERKVAEVLSEISGVSLDTIERNTSIFRLGLDSISAIALGKKLHDTGLARLDVSKIMRNHTVYLLAKAARTSDSVAEEATHKLADFEAEVRESVLASLPYQESQVSKIMPCTPLQEAMLSGSVASPGSSYFNHTIYDLKADSSRVEWVWRKMVERHEILRTAFTVTSHPLHAYAQIVLHDYEFQWLRKHLGSGDDLEKDVNKYIEGLGTNLDIARPPFHVAFFTTPKQSRIVISTHHALYDGFALDLLFEDVEKAYRGIELESRGTFDAVLEHIENLDLKKADAFWSKYLSGLEPNQFPDLTGLSAVAKAALKGTTIASRLCSVDLQTIEDACRQSSISLLSLGQAVWAKLIAAFTGEKDICFGNVVSGRTLPVDGIERIVAPCFNTIPLRITFDDNTTNLQLAEMVQQSNAETLEYQMTPLRRIMKQLKLEGAHLFDTLLILQHFSERDDADLWEVLEDRGEMDFAVVIELIPTKKNNTLQIIMHHRNTVILPEHASVLLEQLDACFASFLTEAESTVFDFSGFSKQLLSISNENYLVLGEENNDYLLHTAFEKHAQTNGSKVALEFLHDDDKLQKLTFAEMNQAANRVAHFILAKGISRDEAVPLCLEKSPSYYIAVLGAMKAGAAFTPIDSTAPDQRKKLMINELGAKLVFANSKTIKNLGELGVSAEVVDIDSVISGTGQKENPVVKDLTPECLVYRLYTSGSTGVPKAVSLEIKSALQTIRASRSIIPWKPESKLLQFAATTFDMCYYDCFMAWNYGFTLCSAGRSKLLGDLAGTIRSMNVTMLDLTPSVADTLTATELPEVELLYCIGEAMPNSVVASWEGRCVNSYGPTEAAQCCTIVPVSTSVKSANIGKPFPTASFFLYSADGKHVMPTFAVGELCIGGDQVAREYYKNAELTSSRFMDTEFGRIYRTGDNVRMLADGTFEFIGRTDDQIKIRGLRVELDEINVVLRDSSDSIKDVTTIVAKHSDNSKENIISFLAAGGAKAHGTEPHVLTDKDSIIKLARKRAEEKLPRYMLPGMIIFIDHIPRSAAGKVDRKVLKAIFSAQDAASLGLEQEEAKNDAPWAEKESVIRSVFSSISQVPEEKILRDSTIYQLGLDSISANQVSVELKKRGLDIGVLDILERPNIRQLSELFAADEPVIESTDAAVSTSAFLSEFSQTHTDEVLRELGASAADLDGVYPCTPAQEGMLSQFVHSDGKLYFNHMAFKLPRGTSIDKLKSSWEAVADLEPILRSSFAEIDSQDHSFAMAVWKPKKQIINWDVVAVEGTVDKTIEKYQQVTAEKAKNAATKPMWYLTLIKATRPVLMFSAHHAIFDAHAFSIILQKVADIYLGRNVSGSAGFNELLDVISRQAYDPIVLVEEKDFWTQHLSGSTVAKFPMMTPTRITATTNHVVEHVCEVPITDIEAGARNIGVPLAAVAQAAWARVLGAYMGEPQVTYGLVLSGRTGISNAENTVFPCITTLPALSALVGTNLDLAKSVQTYNTKLLKFQHTPLKSIQRWFDHPETSFFDSIFVYQKQGEKRSSLWEDTVKETASVDYPISIEVEPSETELKIRATCPDNLIPIEQSELLVQQVAAAMLDIIRNPNHPCEDFTLFPDSLLAKLPPSTPEIPTDIKLLHKYINKWTAICPERTALEFVTSIEDDFVEKREWSYLELDEEGNKVANYLRNEVGVKTGDIVGICFEKCAEASICLVGILKAGAAFVALDYNAPIDRKAFILGDSHAKCVLTMSKFAKELKEKAALPVISVDEDQKIWNGSTKEPEVKDLTPADVCYCLYTSGTTGTPKGCLITHENCVQAMMAFSRLFAGHWDENSRWLQFASFHFDVSVLEQFWSWTEGICVTSAPRDLIFEDLARTIDRLQITHLDLTPSLAALLDPEDVPSLKKGVFITGGEALKQDVLNNWGKEGCLYNGYGPTEVTIGCTMLPRVPANGRPSNIGPQFDNVGSYVLTPKTNKPVLKGALGELCVSGKLVGKGYLNREDLTTERFPFIEEFQERIYRTGDYVRLLHDGCFDFGGRTDDQVKLRGQRLEIGEINEVIKQSDAQIKAVATLVLRHPKQQKDQLVTFFNAAYTKPTKIAEILGENDPATKLISVASKACRKHLPTYMVPTHFLPLSKIPLSVNNKVDNKELTAIYHKASLDFLHKLVKKSEEEDGPLSDDEQRIQQVIADSAGLETSEVTRSSTIFELGLDSVSVVGLARRLRKAGFAQANVSTIMQNPSLEALTTALSSTAEEVESESLKSSRLSIQSFRSENRFHVLEALQESEENIVEILPCTPLQEGMIARFLDSEEALYYNTFTLSVNDGVDLAKLKAAWEIVVSGTDTLRTCFCATPDGYAQVVLKKVPSVWENVSASRNVDDVVAARLQREATSDLHRPPVFVQSVGKTLVLGMFHAIYDGSSVELLLQDLEKAYAGTYQPRPTQFSKVVDRILAVDKEKAAGFWRSNFKEVSGKALGENGSAGNSDDIFLRRKLSLSSDELEKFSKSQGITTLATLQAAWSAVLSEYQGSKVVFGTIVSGRSISVDGAEEIIGPMFNTLPCVVDMAAPSWKDLVASIHKFNSDVVPFHHTPLRMINKWLRIPQSRPLFDTLFVYQKGDESEGSSGLWKVEDSKAIADYPLAVEFEATGSSFYVNLSAKATHLLKKDCESMIEKVEQIIASILKDPSQSPAQKPVTTSASQKAHPEKLTVDTGKFVWSDKALAIRKTIAGLAEVDEAEITEDTSIFEVGLDSIEAIKLSSRLKRHEINLAVSVIMRNATIRKMMALLQTAQPVATASTVDQLGQFEKAVRSSLAGHVPSESLKAIYPATPLQEGMILETVSSEYSLYFNHDVMKLSSSIDISALQKAWETVAEGSDILRTTFFPVQGLKTGIDSSFAQLVHNNSPVKWHEASITSEGDLEDELEEIMASAAEEADLFSHPPWSITLLHTPRNKYLVLSISHALYDGWSLGLLHEDIKRAYEGAYEPRPEYKSIIADICVADKESRDKFWSKALSGFEPTSFPKLNNSPAETTHRAEKASSMSFSTVQQFCKRSGVTNLALAQACWAIVLANYLGKTDVAFGTVLSGRDDQAAEEMMFPAMNTVAVRGQIQGTYSEFLKTMHNNASEMLKYQHTPLRQIQKLAKLGGQRLFDTLFIYQRGADESEENQLWKSVEGSSDVEYNVCVEMEKKGDTLIWRTACKGQIMSQGQAFGLLQRLDTVLSNVIGNPNAPVIKQQQESAIFAGLTPIVNHTTIDSSESAATSEVETAVPGEWTSGEKTVRAILSRISDIPEDEIKQDATIFHLGLDSISAIRIASELKKASLKIGVAEILKQATVSNIAKAATSSKSTSTAPSVDGEKIIKDSLKWLNKDKLLKENGFRHEEVEKVLPCSAGQVFTISTWQNSGGKLFMPTFTYKMEGDIDASKLRKAFGQLLQEEEVLRTVFASTPSLGTPLVQIVLKKAKIQFSWEDSEDDILEEVKERIQTEQLKKFSPKNPPVRLSVVSNGLECHLLLTIHHALYDGVSLPLLISRLEVLYRNPSSPKPSASSLTPLLAYGISRSSNASEQFWKKYLSDTTSSLTPVLHPLESDSSRTAIYKPSLMPSVASLEALSRKEGVSLQALLIALFAKTYATTLAFSDRPLSPPASIPASPSSDSNKNLDNAFQRKDLVIGFYLANRNLPIDGIDTASFPTINVVPLRLRNPRATSLLRLARNIQRDLADITTEGRSLVPLHQIAAWTGVKVDTFFNYLKLDVPSVYGAEGATSKSLIEHYSIDETMQPISNFDAENPPLKGSVARRDVRTNMDVEMAVRNGALDMGIFANGKCVSVGEVDGLMKALVKEAASL